MGSLSDLQERRLNISLILLHAWPSSFTDRCGILRLVEQSELHLPLMLKNAKLKQTFNQRRRSP